MSSMCSALKFEKAQIQDVLTQMAEVQICLLALHTSGCDFFFSQSKIIITESSRE